MHDKVGDMLFRFGREAREFPRAEFTLRDVFRLSPIDPLLDVERQVFISPSHIHELRVTAGFRQLLRQKKRRLRWCGIVRIIGVIARARNVALPVLVEVLLAEVVKQRAFAQRKPGIVLAEHFAKQLHGLQ